MSAPQVLDAERELLLSHFTIENLHEAVYWVDSAQNIIQVNDLACQISGYTKEELTKKKVTDINPSADVMDWPAFWKRLKKEKKITFEAQHKHKKGYLYDIEISGNFIEIDGKEYSCTIVRDIRERKAQEDLMRKHLNEIELYNSTLKNIRDQIYWLDRQGNFIRVNDAVSRETGYTVEELKSMSVFDINPLLSKKEWEKKWAETKKAGQEILETEHRDKEGNIYPVEVTNYFIEHDGQEYFCSSVRDVRKRRREEEILKSISDHTSGVTGSDYFRELAKYITTTLNVRYSMVVLCSENDKTKLRMLSYVDRKEVLDNIDYDTHGTPCEIVMEGKEFFCADKLEETFPREKGIQSWVAVPIYSPTTGKVIGNIAAFDNVPMVNDQNQVAILRIFAARTGAEIERIRAEEKVVETLKLLNSRSAN